MLVLLQLKRLSKLLHVEHLCLYFILMFIYKGLTQDIGGYRLERLRFEVPDSCCL